MGLWPRRNPSKRLSAISPKDSRMPKPALPRVRSSLQPCPRTLRLMRKNWLPGWTSTLLSTASWRPLTTRCPDIKLFFTRLWGLNHFYVHVSTSGDFCFQKSLSHAFFFESVYGGHNLKKKKRRLFASRCCYVQI